MLRAPDNAVNCAQAMLYQAVLCQPYQSKQSQHVYQHTEKKRIYQINNKPSEELEEDLPDNQTYYINNSYDKLQVNFVGIESVCDQCT